MSEFGTIQIAPDPTGMISCSSVGCIQASVMFTLNSIVDAALRQEVEDGQVGQFVQFNLILGGTAASEVVRAQEFKASL